MYNNYNNNNGNGYGRNNGNNGNGNNRPKHIGAAWTGVSKNGAQYIKFKIGDKMYVAFVNNFKQEPKSPDYYIYESQPLNNNGGGNNQANGNNYGNGGNNYNPQSKGSENAGGYNRQANNGGNNYGRSNGGGYNRYQGNTQATQPSAPATQYNPKPQYTTPVQDTNVQNNVTNNIEKTNEEIDDIPLLSF